MGIHHMPGLIICHMDILELFCWQGDMIKRVAGGKIRGRQIKKAIANDNLQWLKEF